MATEIVVVLRNEPLFVRVPEPLRAGPENLLRSRELMAAEAR